MKKLWRNSCSKVAQNIVLDNAFLWRPLTFPFIVSSHYITTIHGNVRSQRKSKRLGMMIEAGTVWERLAGGNDER